MSNNSARSPISYKKTDLVLTLDRRVFKPCEAKVEPKWRWSRLRNEKWLVHIEPNTFKWNIKRLSVKDIPDVSMTSQLQRLELKVDETNQLMKRLSKTLATKEDLEKIEEVMLKNQQTLQDMLKRHMTDLKRKFEGEVEREVGKEKAGRFWILLEKISTISDVIQFAQYVKDFFVFLNENRILQVTLPFLLKMLLG